MYADDIIVMATKKHELQMQLSIVGAYGVKNGIKFNPSKCEILVFSKNYKRSKHECAHDDWQEDAMLNGIVVPEVD